MSLLVEPETHGPVPYVREPMVQVAGAWMPEDIPDFGHQYVLDSCAHTRKITRRVYPNCLDYDRSLRGYPRWLFYPHAHLSSIVAYIDHNVLRCGIEWLRLVEKPGDRITFRGVFTSDIARSEWRPLLDDLGHEVYLDERYYVCDLCGLRAPVISGGAGNVFYVSPSGSDSANGLTAGTPWQTFNRALTGTP